MVSTVPDLAQFAIAHINEGRAGDVQILQAETTALMHESTAQFPVGSGDLNQIGSGLGFGQLRDEPWSYWGHLYDMHGAVGHGGSSSGFSAQMWFVEENGDGYGMVFVTNVEDDFKSDGTGLWYFGTYYKIQVLLMEEASRLYAETHGQ
jgi:hypothetical protein